MNNTPPSYSPQQRAVLLKIATDSIAHGVTAKQPLPINLSAYTEPLTQIRCCFVTLRIQGKLRGCMGTLKPKRPLVEDVAYNAFSSSAHDPRFSAVSAEELPHLDLHISILSEAVPLAFDTIEELFSRIQPGIDGIILRSGNRSGTLLPAVWSHIPDVETFWEHLLEKAGLPAGYWDDDLSVHRYTAESFSSETRDC